MNYFGWYTNSCEKFNEEEYLDKWVKECDGSDPDHGIKKNKINFCNKLPIAIANTYAIAIAISYCNINKLLL